MGAVTDHEGVSMKAAVQIVISGLALAGLLSWPAAQATDIAELPLKASVLAKPNVIFGLDDSGSMDWGVLLDTESGLLWWNGSSAWNSGTGKPLATASLVPYAYLFPVGTDTGGQIYPFNSTAGQIVPPIDQFAWVRSSRFHSAYYDTSVTYNPWSPAYLDGALATYGNATPGAALAHPAYPSGPTLALNADWNSSSTGWTTNGRRFYVQAGMVLPVGTVVNADSTTAGACSGSTSRTLTAAVTVASGRACWASIPFYPATFWQAEECTLGANCVLGPDGATRLRRYEIKTGATFPSGRSDTAELQNFANWFTYYRNRKQSLAASMGKVLEGLTGLRMGVVSFGNRVSVTMYDADSSAADSNGLRVAGRFYKNSMVALGTPTHAAVKHIGTQFDTDTAIVQYACQRNNMFIVTDGFANPHSEQAPAYSRATYGSGAPYTTIFDHSLADFALAYYTNRLRATGVSALPEGKVPTSAANSPNADLNPNLHVNTYAISLGVRGSVWPSATDPFTTAPTWPTPVGDTPSMIDDLWHATINGRGLMYLADNPTDTAAGIRAVLNDILSQTGAQGGIAVSTVNLSRGDSRAYFGTYNPSGWAGDLTANPIDQATAAVNTTPEWSAGTQLLARDWNTRVIAAGVSGAAVTFTPDNVGSIVNPGGAYGSNTNVVNYLRGERANEGTLFRSRTSLMGAVINSEPTVSRDEGVVYVQSGEGMLHAFDTRSPNAGKEFWAFVPESALGAIGETTERAYVFRTKLDGSPVVAKLSAGTKILVAGAGVAGRSFYALDVTSPRDLDETGLASKHLWTFPSAGDATTQAKMGDALGRPVVVKSANAADGDVVLLTSGYNNTSDGKGRLWVLNATTGAVIHEFAVGAGTLSVESGLAQVSAFQESNGTVRYVYGGDLLGNVWRFDLQAKDAPTLLAVLKGPAGDLQPVTAAPELVMTQGKRVVLIGTGRLLDIGDFGNTKVQSFYAIADGNSMPNARSGLTQRTYNAADDSLEGITVDWATSRGWYLDLPAGHQSNSRPTLAYGAIAFVTNTNGGTDCAASSRLWVLDLLTGDEFSGTDYVSTVVSDVANSSGVTALLTADGKIIGSGQDADGRPWQRDITQNNPIQPAKNSWREIRRQ